MSLLYQGGKSRLSNHIVKLLSAHRRGRPYLEPFMGGGSIIEGMQGKRWGNDANPYVVAYFKAAQDGWLPPAHVDRDDYIKLRDQYKSGAEVDPALIGYVGCNFAFGGNFMSGYFIRADSPNYEERTLTTNLQAKRRHARAMLFMQRVKLTCGSYETLEPHPRSLIYCDPPYSNTAGYPFGDFDSSQFWQWATEMHDAGHTVIVSEYEAPPGWHAIWERAHTHMMNRAAKRGTDRLERLFMYGDCTTG